MKANRWFCSSSSGQGCMLCSTSFGLQSNSSCCGGEPDMCR